MPHDDATLAKLAAIVAPFAKADPAQVTRDTPLHGASGIDSLTMIDMVVAVEDAFGVRIPDEEAERFETVGELADFLQGA